MIKNIVFDVGNVLVRYEPAEFIKRFTDQLNYQILLLEELFQSIEWVKYDRGTLTKAELEMQVCLRLPEELHDTAREIIECWHEEVQPLTEMEPVVKALKEQGYQLYILSNASDSYYKFKDQIPAISYIDEAFVSAEWHLLKPEIEIFRAFCSHYQLVPAECYFIDDLPANVEGAMNAGMDGCVFRNDVKRLLNCLAKAGVQITLE